MANVNFDNLMEQAKQEAQWEKPQQTHATQIPDTKPQISEQLHNQISESVTKHILQTNPNYVPSAEAFNPYANGVPQNVTEAQDQLADVSYASQDYANEIQRRIIADHNGYATDDNYQGMLNRTYTDQAYDYIKRANNGAEDTAWNDPNPQDQLFTMIPDWIAQHDAERQLIEQYDKETPTQEQQITQSVYGNLQTDAQKAIMDSRNIEHGNWNLMSWWDKAKYLVVPGSSATKMDQTPDWAKYVQNIFPSIMASGAGAMVGSLLPIPGGGIIGGIIVGGLTYLQGVTDIEIPIINKLLEGLDILSVWTEQAQGAIGAGMSEARKRLEGKDAGLFEFLKTTADVIRDNPYLLEVGKYSYEASADLGFDDILLKVRNAGAKASDTLFGTDFGQRTIDQVSRANLGRSGLDYVEEGTQGYQSLIDTYLPVFTGLVDEAMKTGMTEREAIQFAHQNMEEYLLNYMGTSGLSRDFVVSSVADPMNLLPYVQAKTAEGIGKRIGDVDLQRAGQAAAGNPLIDLLPPGAQQIAEAIGSTRKTKPGTPDFLKTHGSQGLDTIRQTYARDLAIQDVSKLSDYQKRIAGINTQGKLSNLEPLKLSGKNDPVSKVVDWAKKTFSDVAETRMFEFSSTTADFVGSILFEGDYRLWQTPDIVAQLTGRQEITESSPLYRYKNSAVLNTIMDGLRNAPDNIAINLAFDIDNFRKYGTARDVVKTVSEKLHMKPDDIFRALDNDGTNGKQNLKRELINRIRQEGITFTSADGKRTLGTDAVIKNLETFAGDGKRMYSETYLKANIMEKLSTAADEYNLRRLNIQPDGWWTRLNGLAKSMQSIALLNFSTSYMVNNFLNNLLTRSVNGVGGIDIDFVNTVNEKRGLSFSRDSQSYQNTGDAIKTNKKATDVLAKFDELYNKATDNAVFKGVNNIDIEGMETKAAFEIGANRYWEATWKQSIPEFPSEWDALGIDDTTKKKLRDIALDSPNMEVFLDKAMGDVIIPETHSVFENMIESKYDDRTGAVMKDTFSKMRWIFPMLDEFLRTGDKDTIHKGFEAVREKLTTDFVHLENVKEMSTSFESLRNRFSAEGIASIGVSLEALNDLYGDIWLKQTKSNGSLFLDRAIGKLTGDAFDAKFADITKIQTGDYNIVRGYAVMFAAAAVEGLGLGSDVMTKVTQNIMSRFDLSEEYIRQSHELRQKYGIGKNTNPDYNYGYYVKAGAEMLGAMLNKQLDADKALNKLIIDYLRSNLDMDEAINQVEKMQAEVIRKKEKYNQKQVAEWTERKRASGDAKKEKVSLRQEKKRLIEKQNIHNLQETIAKRIQALDNAIMGDIEKPAPMSLADTLRIELVVEEAKAKTDQQKQFLKNFVSGADPTELVVPADNSNTNINTSFYEYGQQKIIDLAKANGTDFMADAAMLQEKFYNGDAVPLGSADVVHAKNVGSTVYVQTNDGGKLVTLKMTDHYELINPNANLKASEYVTARCQPFKIGDQTVNAGVYHNGKLIGYIVEGMDETITVEGKTYPIVGISAKNTDSTLIYVKDNVREVTPGKPKGVDYSMYAEENFHPVEVGKIPQPEPTGQVAIETSPSIREALDLMEDQAIEDLDKARTNGSLLGNLNEAQRDAVLDYANGNLRQAYSAERYRAQRYGETMVDASLLNYSHRYGFDNAITNLMPYQFWMTRSMMNWGKRMITQPAWFSTYARLQKLIEKNKKDFLPSRLEGMVGMLMPNMGDGMGDSLYMDIFNIIFPFQQFYNATDYYQGNLNTIHNNTVRMLEDMYETGTPYNGHVITEDEMDDITHGRGDIYWQCFKENQAADETDTSATGLLGSFINPNVFVDAIYKHAVGKDKDISYSPMFRLGNLIKATGDQTALQKLTDFLGGAFQAPETGLRKLAGIEVNPDGNFRDYYIVSYLANMVTDMEISATDARIAIAEGEGNKYYDEALHRYRQQQAIRMQGGALATELGQAIGGNKDTSVGQIAGSALASMFGAKVYPGGEEKYREKQAIYKAIKASGDKEAMKKFWQENPDYKVHIYSYEDDPSARLHQVLVDQMSDTYYALPYTQQDAVQKAFGRRFTTYFLDKETRATDYLDDDEIIEWTRAMQGKVPNFSDKQITAPAENTQQVRWYVDSVQADYDRYQRDFVKKFPGFETAEDGYYALPESMRAKYLKDNPVIEKGWKFKEDALRANPKLATYMTDHSSLWKARNGQYDSITSAVRSKLNTWTLNQLNNHIQYGWKMNTSAEQTLKTVYNSLGVAIPYDTWIKSLVN